MNERVVLVTGGNRGIGYSIAEEFVRAGYTKVAVTVRSGEGPAGTNAFKADVTDAASLDAAFAEIESQLGPVEILVANAGITKDTLLMRMSDEQFEDVVNTNLNGVFRVSNCATVDDNVFFNQRFFLTFDLKLYQHRCNSTISQCLRSIWRSGFGGNGG